MPRTPPEWIGKTDDAKIPPRVRQRIFDRSEGKCHICNLRIKTGESWQADHRIALVNGGENRESNLAPAHSHCHLAKTRVDVATKKKIARVRGRHTGAIQPKGKIKSRGFTKKERAPKLPVPGPRNLFEAQQ